MCNGVNALQAAGDWKLAYSINLLDIGKDKSSWTASLNRSHFFEKSSCHSVHILVSSLQKRSVHSMNARPFCTSREQTTPTSSLKVVPSMASQSPKVSNNQNRNDCLYTKRLHTLQKTQLVHTLQTLTMCLLALLMVDSVTICKHFRRANIFLNARFKYMHQLDRVAIKQISGNLPVTFPNIFEKWSAIDRHYNAAVASYPSSAPCGYNMVLLGCPLMVNENICSANDTYKYLALAWN